MKDLYSKSIYTKHALYQKVSIDSDYFKLKKGELKNDEKYHSKSKHATTKNIFFSLQMSSPFQFNFSSSFGSKTPSVTSTTSNTSTTPSSLTTSSTSTTTTTTSTDNKQTTPSFNFNFSTPSRTTSSTGNKANEPEKVQIPPEIKNKTVKNILETMESQLEQQAREFQTQARQIARWDRSIYDCIELMMFLEKEIKTVEETQKELAQSAETLLQEQDNFIKTLKEKASKATTVSNDQRAKLYETARKLGQEFLTMEAQLKEIVEQINNESLQDETSDIDKISQIANCHLDSMQWIANQCSIIDEKLNTIQRNLGA